ncbi:hypothetical protein ScPMuIL_004063 [Solemya velum]
MAVNVEINRAPAWNPIKSVAPAPPGGSLSTTVTVTSPVGPPTAHRRQSSGNIPDIVDNDNCLQSIGSDIAITSTAGTSSPTTSVGAGHTQDSGTEISQRNVDGPHNSCVRTTSTLEETERRLSGSSDVHARSHRSSESSTSMVAHPTTYLARENQQIQTQDLNAGVSSRLEPAPHSDVPDLLHSHMVPQPPVISSPTHSNHLRGHMPRDWRGPTPESQARHHRHHRHGGHSRSARQRRSRTNSRSSYSDHEPCKEACYKCVEVTTSFRWILVILSLLGVCCVVTGIVLAALHAAGSSFLFLAIMFIGLGVLLVIVVAVGWKCTPRGHEPLHALFGLGNFRRRSGQRRHHRRRRNRSGNWHGGVLYNEFQHRRPPPTYAASMQEYHLRLANQETTPDIPEEDYSLPSSPPPSYRSRASTVRTGIQITFPPQGDDYPDSRPPTYRSHAGTAHRRPSLPLDDSQVEGGDVAFTGPATPTSDEPVVTISAIVINNPNTPGTQSDNYAGSSNPVSQSDITENMVRETLQNLDNAHSPHSEAEPTVAGQDRVETQL